MLRARKSKEYHVVWEIDLEANSPQEAAEKALEIQRDRDSMATAFDVYDNKGKVKAIDLGDIILL